MIVFPKKEINKVFQQFLKDLYTPDINAKHEDLTGVFSKNLPRLSAEEVEILDSPVKGNEIRNAVSYIKGGQSPALPESLWSTMRIL